ncbi:MAG: hypothetical protein ACQESR_00220 [Planctomycetota bacterium]
MIVRISLLFLSLLVMGMGAPVVPWLLGQETGGSEEQPAASSEPIEEVEPQGLWLRNENGELIYVPDYPYERFEQLLKQQRNLADPPPPAFSMKLMTITGEVVDNRLEAMVEFLLVGGGSREVEAGKWARVPLRFNEACLRDDPSFEGPGEYFLNFEAERGGYVCWLRTSGAEESGEHRVSLPLLIPIRQAGEESRCSLQAPSPLASTLEITVPECPVEGTIRELAGDVGHALEAAANEKEQGVLSTRGIRGDVSISWHEARGRQEHANTRLDVIGSIVVTANELLQEVRSEGRFVVRGFGRPIEVFQVRLPPGMQLRETPEPGYEVRRLPMEEGTTEEGQLVEVRMENPTANEVNIRLVAELPSEQNESGDALTVSELVDSSLEFMPARFVFEGAVRHRGQIDLVTKGDWSLLWSEDAALPRTEPNEGGANDGLSARFRYHNQARALKVWIRRQAARIAVEPTYEVHVNARQVRLLAKLVCRTSGSRAGSLKADLPGWTVEMVDFANVDGSLPVDTSEETLVVPIPVEAQAADRFTLRIEAWQDLETDVLSGTEPLEFHLPMVTARDPARVNLVVSPGTVSVIPADNILLTPRSEKMSALSPLISPVSESGAEPGIPEVMTPDTEASGEEASGAEETEETVFQYRDRGSSEQAVFAGDFKIQPQSISVSMDGTLTVGRQSYGIQQRFSYRVFHEPVDTLELSVPAPLLDDSSGNMRVLLDDEPLNATVLEEGDDARVPVRVQLPKPLLGSIELRIIHPPHPMPPLEADETVDLTVPLVFAAAERQDNTTVIGNTLTIVQQDPIRVEPTGGTWTVAESDLAPGKLALTTASGGGDVTLDVSLRGRSLASSTILDQVWVQTWISAGARRDRAVYRLRTSEPEVRVRVPHGEGVSVSAVEVAVDHHKVDIGLMKEKDGATEFAIPMEESEDIRSHVVELWYQQSLNGRTPGTMTFHPPLIDGMDHVERCYWQLVLPRNEIVVWGNQAQYDELIWAGWSGWERSPLREQRDLERWIGAAEQDGVPPEMSIYLFTSFGAPRPLAVITSSRALLLLVASGVVLAAGLLLVYVPLLRHPAMLLTAGVLVMALALAAPWVAVLLAQAGVLGIVLTLGARLLHAILLRANPGRSTVRGHVSDSKMMELRYSRGDGSSRITTTSAPVAVHSSSVESKPE